MISLFESLSNGRTLYTLQVLPVHANLYNQAPNRNYAANGDYSKTDNTLCFLLILNKLNQVDYENNDQTTNS